MKFIIGGMYKTHAFSTVITTEAGYATRRGGEVLVDARTHPSGWWTNRSRD